jgi:uncharacterized protein (TIGR03085 family)
VSPTDYARTERLALCDLVTELGPDAATLCDGWTTRDLAAHLVIRERRPDAAVGIFVRPLAGYTGKVQHRAADQPFDRLVAQLRTPPAWSFSGIGPLDRAVNTAEFFIHHEDVRRAQPEFSPRPLERGLGRQLWTRLPALARISLRHVRGEVVLAAEGYGQLRVGSGAASVRIAGDPGELVLFASGRQAHARVDVQGAPELVTRVQAPGFGR